MIPDYGSHFLEVLPSAHSAESFSGDSVSPGCGRSWYCDCDLPVDFLHSGITVPVLFGEQLSVPTRKIEYQVQLSETDL